MYNGACGPRVKRNARASPELDPERVLQRSLQNNRSS